MKKTYSLALILLLLITAAVVLFIGPVEASGTIYIRIDGSVDPSDAPISTADNITYTFTDNIYSSIVVQRSNIIVDGNGYTVQGPGSGIGFNVASVNNITILNMKIEAFSDGIRLNNSSDNMISGNNITNNYEYGIYLYKSSSNTISGNNITNNDYGIRLQDLYISPTYTKYNHISGNNITANKYRGIVISKSSRNIISGNSITANNWGIWLEEYSIVNMISGNNITNNDGAIKVQDSSDSNMISGNSITNNGGGISLWDSSNNAIYGNHITNNNYSVSFVSSSSNSIYGNNIMNNKKGGVGLYSSSNNKFFHNNFINNTKQVDISTSGLANFWDNGIEGNYWSNYTGVDLDHDGIGNTQHDIDADNIDYYPLMGMFHSFNTSLGYDINVISNSTIEDFTFFESNSTIRMYVSNSSATQSFGFCRVSIPKNLMSPPYTVIIDDRLTEVLYFNDTVYDNGTHRWIYFAYEHSTRKVDIIPEFPTCTSMLLLLIVILVAITIYKRRLLKTPIH